MKRVKNLAAIYTTQFLVMYVNENCQCITVTGIQYSVRILFSPALVGTTVPVTVNCYLITVCVSLCV